MSNVKQYFVSLDDLYKARLNLFIQTANRCLMNTDHAMDAVHDAFVKAAIYAKKHPGCHFRERVVNVLVIRACAKINKKYGNEVQYETSYQNGE